MTDRKAASSMKFSPGDRVTVAGIPGAHEVVEVATALQPGHVFLQVRLASGTVYGKQRGGDLAAVAAYRCSIVPVDLEDYPRGT